MASKKAALAMASVGLWALTACNAGDPKVVRDKVKTDDSPTQSIPAVDSAKKLADSKAEMKLLTALTDSYCQELVKLRSQCVHASPLVSSKQDFDSICSGKTPPAEITWKASVSADQPVKLVAHAAQYETDYIQGSQQAIVWKKVGSGGAVVRSPQLIELSDLQIKPKNDEEIKINSFALWAGTTEVLNSSDVPLQDKGKSFNVNLMKFKTALDSGKCTLDESTMNALRTKAQNDSQNQEGKDIYGNELNQVLLALEPMRARKASLEKALTGKVSLGCWASVKLNRFEVLIDGGHLEDKSAGTSNSAPSNEGSPDTYSVRFSESIGISHPSESTLSVFRTGGRILTEDLKDFEISQLQFVQIKREGVAFESQQKASGGLFGGGISYQNLEVGRTRLTNLQIKVGGELIYEKKGINHDFEKGKLIWTDKDIFLNPAFQKLFQRSDCPTQK